MKIKLNELIDIFDEISYYEYIIYDKEENDFVYVSDHMTSEEREELSEKIETDENNRYCYLPSRYNFHESELIEDYIDQAEDENLQSELDDAFWGKGKYRRFKEILRNNNMEEDYYRFRKNYLKNMAIEWCKKNNIEFEK